MVASVRRAGTAGLALVLTIGLAPVAGAFLPTGGYNQFNQMRLATWPLVDFDTNNDGNVTTGEGLELLIEGGESGFTAEEIEVVEEALKVWEDVPTSYVSFRVNGIFEDPIIGGSAEPDYLLTINLQVSETLGEDVIADPSEVQVADVAYPIVGSVLTLYAIDDTLVESAGTQVIVPSGNIIDSDIVMNADMFRATPERPLPLVELEAGLVHVIGLMLGLSRTPLNNLRQAEIAGTDELIGLLESEVFWMTGADGQQRFVGVTPTMFPYYFFVENSSGRRRGGWADLSPDDISGISWLYPRGSQANFFTLNHEARTQTRPGTGLPSTPIRGGNIVVWADVDGDKNTPSVPVFSTLTGLYENVIDEQLRGRFNLIGLWKQFEMPGTQGALFNPSYRLTMNAFNGTGFDRQAPEEFTADLFDSIQGSGPENFSGGIVFDSSSTASADDYDNYFPSEVFHEVENIFDIKNHDGGTPLIWDFARDTAVSADTQKTLASILPNNRPMFGDPNDVCPLNIIQDTVSTTGATTTTTTGETETTTTTTEGETKKADRDDLHLLGAVVGLPEGPSGPNALRHFRDTVLLQSAVGTALVDCYYHVSPSLARFLLRHDAAFRIFRAGAHATYWLLDHAVLALIALASIFVAGIVFSWRGKSRALAAGLLLMAVLVWTAPAAATSLYVTTPQLNDGADQTITGEVISVEARWATGGRIYTDVVVEVADKAKGTVNKGSHIAFSVIGGRLGTVVLRASGMPTFQVGESVLLYLRERNGKLVVHGGQRGKISIVSDGKSGKQYVVGTDATTKIAVAEDKAAIAKKSGDSEDKTESGEDDEVNQNRVPLEDYMDYLREITRDQKRAQD